VSCNKFLKVEGKETERNKLVVLYFVDNPRQIYFWSLLVLMMF